MNETAILNPDPDPKSNPELDELRLQHLILRKLFLVTLVVLLISSGGINLYLLRQMVSARKDLALLRPRVSQLVAAYQQNEEPVIRGFLSALVAFSKTHPDFQPILAKYNVNPAPAAPPGLMAPVGTAK